MTKEEIIEILKKEQDTQYRNAQMAIEDYDLGACNGRAIAYGRAIKLLEELE